MEKQPPEIIHIPDDDDNNNNNDNNSNIINSSNNNESQKEEGQLLVGFHEMDAEREKAYQYGGARLIRETSLLLDLPPLSIATALYYFHRFHARWRYRTFDLHMIGGCVYLANKSEETPRKIRDVINVFRRVQYPDKEPMRIDRTYWQLRDKVIETEQTLLRTIGFNIEVIHPHKYLLNYLKFLNASSEVAQLAWSLLNDTYYTPVCLHFGNHMRAASVIYLASSILQLPIKSPYHDIDWWVLFDIPLEELQRACTSTMEAISGCPSDDVIRSVISPGYTAAHLRPDTTDNTKK